MTVIPQELTVRSPIRSRVSELKKKFRSRVTAGGLPDCSDVTAKKRKTVTEIVRDSKRVTERADVSDRDGQAASKTGTNSSLFFTNISHCSLHNQEGQQGEAEEEVPGRLQVQVGEGDGQGDGLRAVSGPAGQVQRGARHNQAVQLRVGCATSSETAAETVQAAGWLQPYRASGGTSKGAKPV